MKKIVSTLFITLLSLTTIYAQSSLSGLKKASKLSNEKVKEIAKAGNSVTASSFMEEMKSKLKINDKQSAEIKPLAEQMLKDKAEVEATKLAKDAKAGKIESIFEGFDGRMKGLLTKVQWAKYLDWIKPYKK